MSGNTHRSNRLPTRAAVQQVAIIAVWACLVVIAMARQQSPAWDDPYIFFRYAENLVNGHGWTFNAAKPTANAATSPALVLLLALFRVARVPMMWASTVIHFCFTVLGSHLTWRALRASGATLGAPLAATVIATSPAFTLMWGMESSLYIALVALIVNLALRPVRWWHLGLAAGLLGLVRPDAVLVGGLSLVLVLSTRGARPRMAREWMSLGAPIIAPSLIWMSVQSAAIGQSLPSTLVAKRAQANSGLFTNFGDWDSFTARSPWSLRGQLFPSTFGGNVEFWVGVLLVVAGTVAVTRRRQGWVVALSLGIPALIAVLLYARVVKLPSYPWYWSISAYAVIVVASVGFDLVTRQIRKIGPLPPILMTGTILLATWTQLGGITSQRDTFRNDYDVIGRWLKTHTPDDATVAAFEIGRISWAGDRTMIDPLGLLDSRLPPFIDRGDLTSWLVVTQPDFWVLSFHLIDAPLRQSPCLARHFIEVFHTDFFSVFKRVSAIRRGDTCAAVST